MAEKGYLESTIKRHSRLAGLVVDKQYKEYS